MSFASSLLNAERRRWLGLAVVCMAQLMIVLDATIVNVALPSIQHDLRFTPGNLTWVINAFLVSFGSFLLLAGRLSDLLGRKRLFMLGLTIFTLASVACGLAPSQGFLIGARFIQGLGAALQASVILALIVTEFTDPDERAKAMSAYVFTAVAGGSLGLLAGGVLTELLSWHWIFFVNLPIGLVTMLAARPLIPSDTGTGIGDGVDWLGSTLVTVSLMTLVYAIVSATTHGWGSAYVLGLGGAAIVMLAAFFVVQARVRNPIMPLRVMRIGDLMGASLARMLMVVGMYSTFFLGTLYLEHIRHFTAVETGFAYMPWTLSVAAMSLGINARLVRRFGAQIVSAVGMVLVAAGLGLMLLDGATTAFFPDVFFAFMLIGLGLGNAFAPLTTIGMAAVPGPDAGLASGITNLAQQVGGALGLAVLSTIAESHSKSLIAHGTGAVSATLSGYHLAYSVGIGSVLVGALVVLVWLRPARVADSAPARVEGLAEVELEEAAVESGGEVAVGVALADERAVGTHAVAHIEPEHGSEIRRRLIVPVRHVRRPGEREPDVAGGRRSRV